MEQVFRDMDAVVLGENAAFLVIEREWAGWSPGCVLHRVIGGPSIYVEQGEAAWWCHRDGTLGYESPPSRFYEESYQDVLLDDARAWWEQRQAKRRVFTFEGVQAAYDALKSSDTRRYKLQSARRGPRFHCVESCRIMYAPQLRERIEWYLAGLYILEEEGGADE